MTEDQLKSMRTLGVEAAKAGKALREMLLSFKKIKKTCPKYKQWQRQYLYHR